MRTKMINDFAYYGYDAANARTYKLRMYNAAQWSNGIPVAWWAKVSGSGGADVSVSLSASMVQFMDFNGDGYADLVLLSTSCQHPVNIPFLGQL